MKTTDPTPELTPELTAILDLASVIEQGVPDDLPAWRARYSRHIAKEVLAAGYVHLVTHLNSLTAYQRLELGEALCREAARMDDEEDAQ